jgi:hypothetical protein
MIIVFTTLMVAFLIGYLASSGRLEAQRAQTVRIEELPISKYEEHILALDREALDKAYKDHIGLVFGVWMKGPADTDAPRRAQLGAYNARLGYEKSVEAIERRERKLKEQR